MKVIGLTGGIASGKSTVSKILSELGAKIIDADLIARKIVEPKEPAWQEIVNFFGNEVLNHDLTLNRKKLGAVVFNDPDALAKLNQITHPKILAEIKEALEKWRRWGTKATFIDAALLIEAGFTGMVEAVWVVTVDPEVQIKRLLAREDLTEEEALRRVNSQTTNAEKIKFAHREINNNGTEQELRQQVEMFWKELFND